jgi:hypothetical protein
MLFELKFIARRDHQTSLTPFSFFFTKKKKRKEKKSKKRKEKTRIYKGLGRFECCSRWNSFEKGVYSMN